MVTIGYHYFLPDAWFYSSGPLLEVILPQRRTSSVTWVVKMGAGLSRGQGSCECPSGANRDTPHCPQVLVEEPCFRDTYLHRVKVGLIKSGCRQLKLKNIIPLCISY